MSNHPNSSLSWLLSAGLTQAFQVHEVLRGVGKLSALEIVRPLDSGCDPADHQKLDVLPDELREDPSDIQFRQGADGVRSPPPEP